MKRIVCHYCEKEFLAKSSTRLYCSSYCRTKVYEEKNIKKMLLKRAYYRANKKGFTFNLSLEDIPDVPAVCPILGIPLRLNKKQQGPDSISIDRIDCKRGYEKGNIRIISHRANALRSNATLEELEKILKDARSLGY